MLPHHHYEAATSALAGPSPSYGDGRLPKEILHGEFYDAPRRTSRPKLCYQNVIVCDIASFHISLQSWEALVADRNRWRASMSDEYSFSATNYVQNMEKRRARRQRRNGP